MSELEKIEKLEKELKARKRKALAKEYEKLGKKFYKLSKAQNIDEANGILESTVSHKKEPKNNNLTDEQFEELKNIADSMQWNGNFWQIKNLTNVSEWLSHFRSENDQQ